MHEDEAARRVDRALLSRLDHAIRQCAAYELSLMQLERRLDSVDVAQWQRLQRQSTVSVCAYAQLCCILAYYGVDYAENVATLLQPYHVYAGQPRIYQDTYGADAIDLLRRLPGCLCLVYRKHRDPDLLGVLLELRLEIPTAYEAYLDALAGLWDEDRRPLLLAAHSAKSRTQILADVLADICRTINSDEIWQAYLQNLDQAAADPFAAVAATARRIRKILKKLRSSKPTDLSR